MPIHLRRSVATYPIRKEMGARSQRRCLPGPIPNPEVKPFCVSPITVVRESTGKEVTVPLSFHLGYPRPARALKAGPPTEAGLFCVQATPKTPRFRTQAPRSCHTMPIDTVDIFGSDQVGIHLAAVGGVVFHPPELPKPVLESIESSLELELQPISIGGSNLVGALVSGNRKGIAVADIATERDIDQLTSYGDVVVMEGGVNTAGNLLVVNDQGAVASPSIPREGLEILSEVLAVDVVSTTVAGQDVVGSLAVANDQGVLLHPDVTPDEAMMIEEVLGVKPMVGTVSFGSPYVGAGVCASNTGAISGTQTTGPELNRIEDALGFL